MFVHSVFGPVPEDLKEVIPADALHSRYLSVYTFMMLYAIFYTTPHHTMLYHTNIPHFTILHLTLYHIALHHIIHCPTLHCTASLHDLGGIKLTPE